MREVESEADYRNPYESARQTYVSQPQEPRYTSGNTYTQPAQPQQPQQQESKVPSWLKNRFK